MTDRSDRKGLKVLNVKVVKRFKVVKSVKVVKGVELVKDPPSSTTFEVFKNC